MHAHYLLKLTTSLTQVKNAIVFCYIYTKGLYSIQCVLYLHMAAKFCLFIMAEIGLPELFEESHRPVSAQFSSVSNLFLAN